MNSITIIGNATKDGELSYTASGQARCQFSVAVNENWYDKKTNDWVENTQFFDVFIWREMAENVAESVRKGDRVIVTGKLHRNDWEDADGNRKTRYDIRADDIGLSAKFSIVTAKRVGTTLSANSSQRKDSFTRAVGRNGKSANGSNTIPF